MKRILLAESTYFIRQLVRRNFQRITGVEVKDVFDSEELDAALAEGGWNLVVLDLGIHGRDGLEVLASIQSKSPELPVILLSANTARLNLARESGAVGAFAIPIDLEQLGAKVIQLLGQDPGETR